MNTIKIRINFIFFGQQFGNFFINAPPANPGNSNFKNFL